MHCPACNNRAVDFAVWAKGVNAFRKIVCPHCGTSLRTSKRSRTYFAASLILVSTFALGVEAALTALGVVEQTKRLILICLVIPLAVGCAHWHWKTGYYAAAKSDEGV